MILASFDLETTGLDTKEDRILEIGLALYSTGRERILEQTSFLVEPPPSKKVNEEVTKITHITQDCVDVFGYGETDAIEVYNEYLGKADAVIGQNILWFDIPLIRNTAKRLGLNLVDKLIIDTMTDIPGVRGAALTKMCAEAKDPKTGRDVSFTYEKHCALDDAKAVLRFISWHDIEAIKIRAQSPTFVVRSFQERGDANNKLARKAGFIWNGDFKIWWQAVKECDYKDLASRVPFQISITKDYPLEQLRGN